MFRRPYQKIVKKLSLTVGILGGPEPLHPSHYSPSVDKLMITLYFPTRLFILIHPSPSPFILGRREFLVKIRQKFDHFLMGHSSAPWSKFEKMKKTPGTFFVVNAQKNLCNIPTRATPSIPRFGYHPPKFFETVSNFWGSPRRG